MAKVSHVTTSALAAAEKEAVSAPAADGSMISDDETGRRIKVRRMGPLQRLRLFKAIGPELSQNDRYLGYAVLAASVVEIDGQPVPFPATELQIEALIDRLGDHGFAAVGRMLTASTPTASVAESAKN